MNLRRLSIATLSLLLVALASAAFAQRFFREGSIPPQFPPPNFEDGTFMVCKVMYTSVVYEEMGIGWATDYPYAGTNLMTRLSELTKTPVSLDAKGEPNFWVVRFTDDALFKCPFIMASDVGTLQFSPEEVIRLREYLLKGGLLWVDDFWGTSAWLSWSAEIGKVLPEYPIFDVPMDHPVFHTMFRIEKVPQITNIQFWRRSGGRITSERGADSPHANFRGIADEKGRLMVVMTHNTDVGDSWEREAEDHEFFLQFSPEGYALGLDVLLYAMTH